MDKMKIENDNNGILFDAKNYFYIGNYMNCINTVLPEQQKGNEELLSYSYLSYIAIDSGRIILSEIKENNPTALIALRYLYEYMEKPEKKGETLNYFIDKIQDDKNDVNIWLIVSAIIFCNEGLYENALKSLHGADDLECMALTIQCLLKLNRVDLAKQILVKMQQKSDDATLTQLAQAWISIAIGGDQLQDAYHIYQEFCEKYSSTPLLLNGQAVCHIGQEKYEEAEDALKESLSKKHNDFDTLVNLIVLSHLTGKTGDMTNRYMEQLKQFHEKSSFVQDFIRKEEEFDRLCQQYEPTNKTSNIFE